MRRFRGGVLVVSCLVPACLVVAGGRVAARDGVRVTVGFEGVARVGAWTPVIVRLPLSASASTGTAHVDEDVRVFAHAEDPDGGFVRSPPAFRRTDGPDAVFSTTVRPGRPTGLVKIEVDRGGAGETAPSETVDHLLEIPSLVPSSQKLVVVIGDLPDIQRACRLLERDDGFRPRPMSIADPTTLGRTPLDFDAADAVVVCGTALTGKEPTVPEEVVAAIDGWVRDGGQLLLLSGASAAGIDARSTAATLLPGRPSKLVPLRRAAALETFAKAIRPLEQKSGSSLSVPVFESLDESSDAVIEVFEGAAASELPLVVRRAHGFGTILWAAVDADRPPIRGWQGTDTLLSRLLERCLGRPQPRRDGESTTSDLAGQLSRAVDTFDGAATVPFGWIALIAAAYVVALYPGGWWVTEWVKRRGAADTTAAGVAWLLLPVTVAAFAAVPWAVAGRWRADAWLDSRCEVADVDAGDGRVRVHAFAGMFSPVNTSLDLRAAPSAAIPAGGDPRAAISWFAPSGQGIGGTDAPSPHPSLASADYRYGDGLGELLGVPIAAAASRLFEVRWDRPTAASDEGAMVVAGRLDRDGQAALRGRIESRLPFALENATLAHAGWLYDVGRLAPAGVFDLAAGKGPRSLAASLTRQAATRDRDVAERYDTAGRDAARILEIASLHAAAGGAAYTSLESGRLVRLDLSPLLDANRAILVGTGPAATAWTRATPLDAGSGERPEAADAATRVAIWRIVIPVGRDLGDTTTPERRP